MTAIKGTSAYPKIYTLGTKEVLPILTKPVEVTEKVDGSQIGFGVSFDGELIIRSKGSLLNHVMPTGLFRDAVAYILTIKDKLEPGWFYYGECLQSPRHNKLRYDRVPKHNVALYGVKDPYDGYAEHDGVRTVAERLGFDCVPLLFTGTCTLEKLEELLQSKSFLGGEIEGLVIASTELPGAWEPFMQAKLVRDDFKEVMRERKPKAKLAASMEESVDEAFRAFRTEARWDKAIQHLRENGAISGSNSDIGLLIKEIQRDVIEEEGEYVKEMLWTLYRRRFLHAVVDGFPKYYQQSLLCDMNQ